MFTRTRLVLGAVGVLLILVAIHFLSGIGLPGPLPNADHVYAGTTTLDRNGEAIVQLPSYVRERDNVFNYFVDGFGVPMPTIHIKSQLNDQNQFSITGGKVAQWEIIGHKINK